MERADVRWIQRYANYRKSVVNLDEAPAMTQPTKLERQGQVKSFELCFELAWKTIRDYLVELGFTDIAGPRPVIRRAFQEGVITDGEGWALMQQAQNESVQLYDEDHARSLETQIRSRFADLLRDLDTRLRREVAP